MQLPFKSADKVLELGGGANPTNPKFWTNVDCRWLSQVDIVADFNYPLPIPDCSYDGVFSKFSVEHISWRKVRVFISEMFRVLRPGGMAFVVTANLLEQCKKVAETIDWNDDLVCMVFGDLDYPENSHKCGFSPQYAIKLFREAGFYSVEVQPLEGCITDMVILAVKSGALIS